METARVCCHAAVVMQLVVVTFAIYSQRMAATSFALVMLLLILIGRRHVVLSSWEGWEKLSSTAVGLDEFPSDASPGSTRQVGHE